MSALRKQPAISHNDQMESQDPSRSARRGVTGSAELLAQRLAERVIDIVVQAVDINAVLNEVDLNELLEHVDMDALLDRIDINDVVARIDMDKLVEQTDLGAIIARSTGGMATEALDGVRSDAVGLDRRIDRWVTRLLRRKDQGPLAPRALLGLEAQP